MQIHESSGSFPRGCGACKEGEEQPFPFTMAFQPIVQQSGIFAYEALVRGPAGESAGSILAQVNEQNMYAFDQSCRVKAIDLAARLNPARSTPISINFMPGAIYEPAACIRRTLAAAERVGLPLANIIFEVTESERVTDRQRLISIFREYRKHGLQTAIDDFGAGYAGLDLLADFQPDILKVDLSLIRSIDARPASQAILRAIVSLSRELNIRVIAEGIETVEELRTLEDLGLELFQGYLFGRPQLEAFGQPLLPCDLVAGTRRALAQPAQRPAHESRQESGPSPHVMI